MIIAGAMEGLGKGMAQTGTMLQANYFEEEKAARLEAIKQKWYDKERADKLSDRDDDRAYQDAKADKARADAMLDYGAKKAIDEGYGEEEKQAKIDYYKSMATENRSKADYYSGKGSGGGSGLIGSRMNWEDVSSEFSDADRDAILKTGKRANGSALGGDYQVKNGAIMINRTANPDKPMTESQQKAFLGTTEKRAQNDSQIKVDDVKKWQEAISMETDPEARQLLLDRYNLLIGKQGGGRSLDMPSPLYP